MPWYSEEHQARRTKSLPKLLCPYDTRTPLADSEFKQEVLRVLHPRYLSLVMLSSDSCLFMRQVKVFETYALQLMEGFARFAMQPSPGGPDPKPRRLKRLKLQKDLLFHRLRLGLRL